MIITYRGIQLEVEADYEPFVGGKFSGPPETCYPDEGGYAAVHTVVCGEEDITDLLSADVLDDLNKLAYAKILKEIDDDRREAEWERHCEATYY